MVELLAQKEYAVKMLNLANQQIKYLSKNIAENRWDKLVIFMKHVRSKSEKILADKFYMQGSPYVYEIPIYLEKFGYIHPDFIVLNKRTRKEYFWEHFGLMDQVEYCEKAIRKIESYQRTGIHQGLQLILTYETRNHPLNMRVVEELIQFHLK